VIDHHLSINSLGKVLGGGGKVLSKQNGLQSTTLRCYMIVVAILSTVGAKMH